MSTNIRQYVLVAALLLLTASTAPAATLSVQCGATEEGSRSIGAALKLLQGSLSSGPKPRSLDK